MSAYLNELDVVNQALQNLGIDRINTFTDHSSAALETAFRYPKARDTELRAHFWQFALRRAILYAIGPSTYLWTPPTYSSATTYAFGQVVVDGDGRWWQSKINSNTSALPNTKSGVFTASAWQPYFGSDVLQPFVAASTSNLASPATPTLSSVSLGSLGPRTVYVKITYTGAAGESQPSSEASLVLAASHVVKVTSPAASSGATGYNVYASDGVGTEVLQTSTPINIGTDWTEPSTGITPYGAQPPSTTSTSFFAGDLTFLASSGVVYLSIANGNTDTPPTTQWIAVNGTYAALQLLYPIGTGPITDPSTKNVYRLPHGYLLRAPSDPRRTATPPYLGAAVSNYHEDWVFEGGCIVSAMVGPLLLRYVADFLDVSAMDAEFCDAVAAKMSYDMAAKLIDDKKLAIEYRRDARRLYRDAIERAAGVGAIETAGMDPEFHDFVACRA